MSTRSLFSRAVICVASRAAAWPAARRLACRFYRAHKCADELPVDLRTHRIVIKSGSGKKIPRLLTLVNARSLPLNRFKPPPPHLPLLPLFFHHPLTPPTPQF